MKALLNMLGFMAVVNLLALLIFVGWLWRSGRLDRDRVQGIRQMLATPIAEATAADEAAAAETEAEAARRADAARVANPPLSSTAQNRQEAQLLRHESLVRRRIEDERRLLLAGLDAQVQTLEERHADLARAEREQQGAADGAEQDRGREQFAKAVRQLESVPAKQAKAILTNLVAQDQLDQAVAYLDAMKPRAAAKVLREFKSDVETELATELLEALRTYGVDDAARKDSGDDATSPAASTE